MKLNKENYELVMFDLLEGNLSEADELRVMEQIEEDEFLFKEWKLFKSTVLIADKDVVYSNKNTLLKEEKAAVIPIRRTWMAIAASICIFATAYIFWPNQIKDQPIAIDKSVTEQVEDLPTTNNTIETIVAIDETEVDAPKTPQLKTNYNPAPVFVSTEEKRAEVAPLKKLLVQEERAPKIENLQEESFNKPTNENVALEEIKKEETLIEEPQLEDIPEEVIAKTETPTSRFEFSKKEIAKAIVTKDSRQRIKEKANQIIALVSNPKIRFKPSFKSSRPSLEIELETSGYTAIASLQPFKNRNN